MRIVLDQLARSTLLPEEMAAAILAGRNVALEGIVTELAIGTMDAEAVTRNDRNSTWNERRLARQSMAVAFLSALAWTNGETGLE